MTVPPKGKILRKQRAFCDSCDFSQMMDREEKTFKMNADG